MRAAALALARVLALACLVPCGAAMAAGRVLDDFSDPRAWTATGSDQVRASMRKAGARGGLCLDYDFAGVSGYAVLRRELRLEYPENYAFELRLHGNGPANDFQFKLVDASGDNVWWHTLANRAFARAGEVLRIRKRQISFAWGPARERAPGATARLELVVAAGRDGGGKGSLCFDRLAFLDLPPVPDVQPAPWASASSAEAGSPPGHALDGLDATAWRSAAGGTQTLAVDFGVRREFNGVSLRWLRGERAADFDVEGSDDGARWKTLRRVRGGAGDFDALFLPESEARCVRLRLRRGPGVAYALAELELHDAKQWPDMNAVFMSRAANAPRGRYPRAYLGEQAYWTLVGVDGGGARSALLSEDGAIESGRGGFSVEPFVRLADGNLVSWADVRIEHRLRDGYLPLPVVRWVHPLFTLDIEAAAQGSREQSHALARFELRNDSAAQQALTLVLAVRPLQVNPPQQFLGIAGGASAIRALRWRGGALHANGRPALFALRAPDAVVASPYDGGPALDPSAAARAAPRFDLTDTQGYASAALFYRLTLPADARRSVAIVLPLSGAPVHPGARDDGWVQAQFDAVADSWRGRLNRVSLSLPASGTRVHDTLRTALAHILMSRDGAALQPGTRSYARSWIRDGAMMVAALLRMGEVRAAREFVDWFAGHLFASGKVPCCVDGRGADPVAENDSHGQFIYAVAEIWRYTRDAGFVERHWSQVAAAVRYMEHLRQSERIGENRSGARASWWGLMPASISHEGYSDKPMHSYWDDFWALRGFKDAVVIARALGRDDEALEIARWRDEFESEFMASIRASAAAHGIAYIPGAAELGDFDATSTTVALDPAQSEPALPPGMIGQTFERYWREARERAGGTREWQDYTPYELRTVGAFVRLGQPERAHAMLRFFFNDQRPAGWNQWAEVVAADPRHAKFVGDMPHAWVSSDYMRSALDLLAYAREADQALVIAAGVPEEWLGGSGLAVEGLPTPFGPLAYTVRRAASVIVLDAPATLAAPPGGFVLRLPALAGGAARARLNGRDVAIEGGEIRFARGPARIEIEPR